jgi:prophage maintenance system killer protein
VYTLLTKKDLVAFNKEIGEAGSFNNEASVDFALSIGRNKKNWIYELSYLVRSLLIDHVFHDGNKRTCFLAVAYFCETNKKTSNREQLVRIIIKITRRNITNPSVIARLIYYAIREENN